MKGYCLTLVTIFIFLVINTSFAQSSVVGEYNWCDDASAWGDGRCEHPNQLELDACYQMLGWYLPRIENNEIALDVLQNNSCLSIVNEVSVSNLQASCITLNVNLASRAIEFDDCPQSTAPNTVDTSNTSVVNNEQAPPVVAQSQVDSDPNAIADDYNWCGDPEVWGDGRCNYPDRDDLTSCHWKMGWYLPRVERGEFSIGDIESDCIYIAVEEIDSISIVEKDGCKYLVVVLVGSPTTETADITVTSDNYDGSTEDLGGCRGLRIHGNNNGNVLTGSAGNDQIYGYGGDDIIYGDSISGDGSGDDYIEGGDGADNLIGDSLNGVGSGNDTIHGGNDADFIYGDSINNDGSGNDQLDGNDANDTIYGDSVSGNGSGQDTINGGDGDDNLYGDTLSGDGSGDDTINGGEDDDTIFGDTVSGDGTGDDTINGDSDSDTIYGDSNSGTGSGDDTIDGGTDTDNVNGPGNSDDHVTDVETDNSTGDN